MSKVKASEFTNTERLEFLIRMASFPNRGLVCVCEDPTGTRGEGNRAYVSWEGSSAVYAPDIYAAIDKAIRRERAIQLHQKHLKEIGCSA